MVSTSRVLTSLFVAFLCSGLFPGCGWRTGLDLYDDGGVPSRIDGGPRDAGPDARRPDTGGTCRSAVDCDDGLICNGFEDCLGGRCVTVGTTDCIDGIDCTIDSCVEGVGCVFEPNDMLCGPGSRCDTFSGCVPIGGGCRGDFDCDNGNVCDGMEVCDFSSGLCIPGFGMLCPADFFDCTIESCDPVLGCTVLADNSLCPPGELCRLGAGCQPVRCRGSFDCTDGDPCNGEEVCDAMGRCAGGPPLRCDDGVPCTLDRCETGVGCVSSVTPEQCSDGADNDCNGLVDCADPICMGRPECGTCVPIAPREFRCSDGRDDDCDRSFDCGDPDCFPAPECSGCVPIADTEIFCTDGRDDDCDRFFDCADDNCAGRPECGPCTPIAMSEIFCSDGRDDDCNGLFDCEDPPCAATPGCGGCVPTSMREFRCSDGLDDDCDFLFDCGDPDCSGSPECGCVPISAREFRCRDGLDDDCDGSIDCGDPDCFPRPICMGMCTATAPNEIGVATCTNGRDDDCDGRLDCADPDCSPFGPMSECCNGRDDNGDGNVDEFTCFCESNADCVGVGTLEQVCWLNTFSICAPDCRRVGSDTFCRTSLPDLPRCNRTTGECEP